MTNQKPYEDISHTVYLSSNIGKACEHCGEYIGAPSNDVAHGINHYISKHGYRLLHVGQEWSEDNQGKTIHHTVAIVGK
jgi:hypothetical protein